MGAIPGATVSPFRVWAPHAEKVYVTGSFNGWDETSTPLANEENGYWSAEVAEAKPGTNTNTCFSLPRGISRALTLMPGR